MLPLSLQGNTPVCFVFWLQVVTKSKKKSKKAVLAGSGKSGKGPGMDDDYDTYGNDMDDFM